MNTFGMNVVASDKTFYQGRGVSITLPAKDGGITIPGSPCRYDGCHCTPVRYLLRQIRARS